MRLAMVSLLSGLVIADVVWQSDCSSLSAWNESSGAAAETGADVGGIRIVNYGSGPFIQMNSWWDDANWTSISSNTAHIIQANTVYECTFSIMSFASGTAVTLQLMDVDDGWSNITTVSANPSASSPSDCVIAFDSSAYPGSVGSQLAVGVDAGWWNNLAILQVTLQTNPPPANTVLFSTSDPGLAKAIPEWGADTCWPSTDNMRHCITHMGADEIDVVRLNFYLH